MTWESLYEAPTDEIWQGRLDSPTKASFYQIVKPINLIIDEVELTPNSFALIGFNSDEGIRRNHGRVGAAFGPHEIRRSLGPLAVLSHELKCYDVGNVFCIDNNLEATQQALGDIVAKLRKKNVTPFVLGGGHELAWGHFQGIQQTNFENGKIINFDAHLDMRTIKDNQSTSGTPFLQIANSMQKTGMNFDYHCIGLQSASNHVELLKEASDRQVKILSAEACQQQDIVGYLKELVGPQEPLYVSICLDVFSAANAPGVSAPQSLGLTPWQLLPAFQFLAASGAVISYDIAELSPQYDIDARTAKLAANIIHHIMHHHIYLKR